MKEQKTQIAHAIFEQSDLDAAVLTYRERVREGDSPELKNMLRKQALDAHCPLSFENLERAKSVLGQLILADTEKMFEPEPDPELTGERTPESLQSAVLELLTDPATDAGGEEGWTSAGIAYRLDEEHETVKATLQTLIDAGKVFCREAETFDGNLYLRTPDKTDDDSVIAVVDNNTTELTKAELPTETSEPETDEADEPNYLTVEPLTDEQKAEVASELCGIDTSTETSQLEARVLAEVEKGDNFHCQSISDAVNAPIADVLTALEQLIIAGKVQLVGESSFKLAKKSLFGVKIHRDDIDKTITALETADAPVSVAELAKTLNTNSAKVAHAIGQLLADGRAVAVGYNQYKLGDVGTSEVDTSTDTEPESEPEGTSTDES